MSKAFLSGNNVLHSGMGQQMEVEGYGGVGVNVFRLDKLLDLVMCFLFVPVLK